MKIVWIVISALLLTPNFFKVSLQETPVYDHKEKFDPGLAYINSTQKLIEVADSIAAKEDFATNSFAYARTVSFLLRNKFYHGFSKYALNQNWIAAVGARFFGYGLDCIVNPDDILQYNYGGCSQQSMVLMQVMKTKGIPYRYVGFPHHYATELKFNNNWYYFDPNMEPNIPDSDRIESKWRCCADSLKKYYDTIRFKDLDWKFGKNLTVTFGATNAPAAPRAALFHTATLFLSKTLWLFPLLIVFYRHKKSVKV